MGECVVHMCMCECLFACVCVFGFVSACVCGARVCMCA